MDKALEKLRGIGIDKIKEDTKLDITKIELILDKKFDKLDRVRARGFINILERQYHLDLSQWLDEYQEFHNSLCKEEKQDCDKASKVDAPKSYFAVCVLAGIFGVVLCFFLIFKNFLFSKQNDLKEEKISNEIKNNHNPLKSEVEELGVESKNIQSLELLSNHHEDQVEKKEISSYGEQVFPRIEFDEENILYIESEKPLWVGIIDIETKKRNARIKQEFEVSLNRELLINVARGGFVMSLDDENVDFGGYLPLYFVYTKEGGLRKVSKEEFILINDGVQW